MNRCAYCQSNERQVKAGKTEFGSQRYQCQNCQRRYCPTPKEQGYPEALRRQALQMYVEGINFRRIGRLLKVSHVSVMNWVKAASDQLPAEPPMPKQVTTIEEDELFTFVGKKKTSSIS